MYDMPPFLVCFREGGKHAAGAQMFGVPDLGWGRVVRAIAKNQQANHFCTTTNDGEKLTSSIRNHFPSFYVCYQGLENG